MRTTIEDLKHWFEDAQARGASHLVVVCDSFSYEDYPVYCQSKAQALKRVSKPGDMQRVMEVYDISLGWEAQAKGRSWNL